MEDIALDGGSELDGVIVNGNLLIDPQETSLISLTREQIEKSPNIRNTANLVRDMSAEIKSSEDGELFFRGSRSNGVIQFVDGIKNTGTLYNLPGRAIGSIAVYTGGIPAKYGDTTSGVIVMVPLSYFDLYYAKLAGK